MKICTGCHELKALDSYGRDSKGKNTLKAKCKVCHNAAVARSKKLNPTRVSNERIQAYHVYTARKRANAWERVEVCRVYERDGWTCQLCFEPVEPSKKFPDPLSKSIDHIDPVSKGGPHMYFNVQLAHLVCNMSKGNRR